MILFHILHATVQLKFICQFISIITRFSAPTTPGATDKAAIVDQHLTVFKEQVEAAQEFKPTLINSHSCKVKCLSLKKVLSKQRQTSKKSNEKHPQNTDQYNYSFKFDWIWWFCQIMPIGSCRITLPMKWPRGFSAKRSPGKSPRVTPFTTRPTGKDFYILHGLLGISFRGSWLSYFYANKYPS